MKTAEEKLAELSRRHSEALDEIQILKAQLAGDIPAATFWLQQKVWRQRQALDILNRRVVTQRFVLRTLDELGRSLTRDEYIAARDKVDNKQLKERIDKAA